MGQKEGKKKKGVVEGFQLPREKRLTRDFITNKVQRWITNGFVRVYFILFFFVFSLFSYHYCSSYGCFFISL